VERIEPLNVPVPPWFQALQEQREELMTADIVGGKV
jgi:hypothetical protein